MLLNANVWNYLIATLCGLLACLSATYGGPDERSDTETALELFRDVPSKLQAYVADAEAIVAQTAEGAPIFEGPVSRKAITRALSSVAQSVDKLTLGVAPFTDLPTEIHRRAKKQTTRWIFYSAETQVHYILSERAVASVSSEQQALRAIFVERFEEESADAACPGYVRRALANSLGEAVEQRTEQKNRRPQNSVRRQPIALAPHVATMPHTHPHAPVLPDPMSQVRQAQTDVEVARLRAELERTRLEGELDRTSLKSQLAAAQDPRRSLEEDFERWLEQHQDKDRELGKDFDFRREQRSGKYQPEFAPYNATGGWGTTNAYGAGGASIFYCDVCGEWLRLPQRFQPIKPR